MHNKLEFLVRHGYLILFFWVLVEQMGIPVPAAPLLLAAGALARTGQLSPVLILLLSTVAALIADATWYGLGILRGGSILNFLCRISLEPDSCVRRTENVYVRYGARSLLFARFVPGLATAAPPLAGVFRMRLVRFLLFDGLGAILWTAAFAGLGFAFGSELERVADYALRLGTWLVILLAGGLAGYILWKYFQRKRFMHELRVARITPLELKQKLDSGEEVQIVDLRHSIDFEADRAIIPGAVHFDPTSLENESEAIARDREVVLYCT